MLKFLNGRLLGTCIDDPAAGGGGGAADAWHKDIAGEDLGYFQNRGWDKVDAKTAAINAGKAHREAEKLIGAPADKIVRLPNDPADKEAWRQVQLRLGVPKDESGYDFKVIKHADGSDLTADEQTAFAKQALKLGLRPADALEFVSDTVKAGDTSKTAGSTEAAGKLAAEKSALATNWGPNYEANMFVAKQAAGALGVKPEAIAALEKTIGYAATMEMFRTIGTKIGEDRFVQNPALGGGTGAMTKEQAMERKSALMADKVWTQAYLNGDAEKGKEMLALNTMIVGR